MSATRAYIALGANVGDRAGTLARAVAKLREVDGVTVLAVSELVETLPVGGPDHQPAYLNGAVAIETTLSPQELLAAAATIESQLGRNRQAERRWGPRMCDLDILLMGETVLDTDDLTIPHPRMAERAFVLRPLVDIAPEARHPVLNKTAQELLAELETNT